MLGAAGKLKLKGAGEDEEDEEEGDEEEEAAAELAPKGSENGNAGAVLAAAGAVVPGFRTGACIARGDSAAGVTGAVASACDFDVSAEGEGSAGFAASVAAGVLGFSDSAGARGDADLSPSEVGACCARGLFDSAGKLAGASATCLVSSFANSSSSSFPSPSFLSPSFFLNNRLKRGNRARGAGLQETQE